MSGAATWAFVIGGIGTVCLLALLGRLWAIGGRGEAPLGPLHPPRPDDTAPTLVPSDFRLLIAGEAMRWKDNDWPTVLARLDRLAATFDAGPPATSPPRKFSAQWLDERVRQIETNAGGTRTAAVPDSGGETTEETSLG